MKNLFNLVDYQPSGLITFALGCIIWLIVYLAVMRYMVKSKNVTIPMAAIMANFAWEINWAWFYKTNMGELFVWLYYGWFFFDCVIVFLAFKIVKDQVSENIKPHFFTGYIFYFLAWLGFFYYFIPEYDDDFGGLTGYLVNCHMSFIYLSEKIRSPQIKSSKLVAFGKCLGTALCVPICWQRYPDHLTLKYLTILFFVIDIIYIYFVFKNDKEFIKS